MIGWSDSPCPTRRFHFLTSAPTPDRRPSAPERSRLAETITFFALILCVLQVWVDMGRPDRVFYPFIWGRYQSPFLWDFTAISVYLLSSGVYLYLPMLPDLARLRDHMTGAAPWQRRLYTILALGWHGSPEQHRRPPSSPRSSRSAS